MDEKNEKKPGHGPEELTVTVHQPSDPAPKQFTWPKTKKVGEAAAEAAAAFDITVDQPSFQNADGQVLDRNKPLVAEKVNDGDVLDIVSAGGGV